jgi:hypothetical protein
MIRETIRRTSVLFFLLALANPCASGQAASAAAFDSAQKKAIVDEISTLQNKNYIFPETAKKIEDALRGRLQNGDFDKLSDPAGFSQFVSRILLEVSKDKQIGFAYNPRAAAEIRILNG